MVSDAASSKAVVLMLINCLLFLPFFWSLLFCCKVLVYHLGSLIVGCTKGIELKTSPFEDLHA